MEQTKNCLRGVLCAGLCLLAYLGAGIVLDAVGGALPQGERRLWGWRLFGAPVQALAALGAARAAGLSAAGCGLRRPAKGGLTPALCCCAAAVGFGICLPVGEYAVPADGAALLLCFLRLCPMAALTEELVFRGAMQGLLTGCGRAAIWAQAAVFAQLHGSPAQRFYALTMGLLLGWLRQRTGSIWTGAALHCFNNTVVFLAGRWSL